MPYQAKTTPGTKVKILDATPLLVEGVSSATAPAISRPRSEWTPISETTVSKFKTGRPAYGPAQFSAAFDTADPSLLRVLALAQAAPGSAIVDWEWENTDQGNAAFKVPVYVSDFSLDFANEGVVKMNWSVQATGAATKQVSPTAVTPNAAFDPEVCQGAQLQMWIGGSYTKIDGVQNFSLKAGGRASTPATAIDASAASVIPGFVGEKTLEMEIAYDSTLTTSHGALFTSANALTPVADKFKIVFPNAASITLDPVNIDKFEFPAAPGLVTIKVSGVYSGAVTIA
jgi:hypothetical protein